MAPCDRRLLGPSGITMAFGCWDQLKHVETYVETSGPAVHF